MSGFSILRPFHLALGLSVCAVLTLAAGPVHAEVTKEMRKNLNKVNSLSQQGMGKMPRSYRKSYEKNKKKFEEGEAIFKEAEPLMTPDLKEIGNYEGTERRYLELKNAVELGRLALPCLETLNKIEQAHGNKKAAKPEWLDEFDERTKKLADAMEKPGKWWVERAQKARTKNEQLIKDGAAAADKALASAAIKGAHDAMDHLDFLVDDMNWLVKDGKPVPEEMLADLEKSTAEVAEKYQPKAKAYYDEKRINFAMYNAWALGDGAPDALAKALGAAVITKGKSKGKKLKYSFPAKADHCYAELSRWDSGGKAKEKSNLDWDAGKKYADMQRFSIWKGDVPWGGLNGFCTTGKFKATRKGKLEFAGSKAKMTYVVVEWPREKFPIQVAAHMSYFKGDPCDPKVWENLWTKPVPGSLVFQDGEPMLWKGRDDPWCEVMTAQGRESRVQFEKLVDKAPEARALKGKEWFFSGCFPPDLSDNKVAIKYGKCVAKVNKKYAPKFSKAKKARDRAKTLKQVEAADKKLSKVQSKYDKERQKKCGPIQKKITKQMNKAYTKIADWHADNAYADHLDVLGYINDQNEGQDRPMAAGKKWRRSDTDAWNKRRREHQKEQGRKGLAPR